MALGEGVEGLPEGARVTCATNQPEPSQGNPFGIRVIGSEYDGAFAQFCVVPAHQLYDVSISPLSDIEIGAMPCAFGTAENLLSRAGVAEDDDVLITGASGGVGLAALQLSTLRGSRVTGVSSPAKREAVIKAGANEVLDRDAA
ncbi:MAG: alcohol dehydrogenase, partial [Xanthomonadales bacterium]|nr:alcohol dehydrogenase [Xanthomonadales bacterium]